MLRLWSWCAAISLVVPAAVPEAGAATVRERTIAITIRPDGSLREHTRLEVAIENADDAASWSTYRIVLDENRRLEALEAFAISPQGERIAVGEQDQDTLEYSGERVFYASRRYRLLSFRDLAAGWAVAVEHVVVEEPYYPASRVLLRGEAPIERLEVSVDGGGPGWRWRLDGPREGLEVEQRASGVTVRARDLPAIEVPVLAPGGALMPVLRFGWSGDGSWRDVGRWYQELLDAVPRASPAVSSRARELVAGCEEKRARLDRLVDFMQQQVRYVSVVIGIHGYRPSAPEEVLGRMWGDCKDKSLLLVELLAEAGIDAYPAMLLAARDRRIDSLFPSPEEFNHMIVAVPDDGISRIEGDAVGDGFLFVDPNQSRGASRWLHPKAQDQEALIVRPGGFVMARTPIVHDLERRSLEVELEISPQGDARGRASLDLGGELAATFLEEISGMAAQARDEEVRSLIAHLLPGFTLSEIAWSVGEDEVPAVGMKAAVVVAGLVRGVDSSPSLEVPGMRATPEPRLMADREIAMVVPARSVRVRWKLSVPEDWCPPRVGEQRVANALGFFAQSVARPAAGRIMIERTVELRERWIVPEMLPALRELALAEHRAHRRRIRLRCDRQQGGAED
ncbi:MAG: hypothetical protein GY856_10515 [bacterium]|nr:hypothetical protein [bacterium]